jgi:hypothetical protein
MGIVGDPGVIVYERPAEQQIRTVDVPPIPRRIFTSLEIYNENTRGSFAAIQSIGD